MKRVELDRDIERWYGPAVLEARRLLATPKIKGKAHEASWVADFSGYRGELEKLEDRGYQGALRQSSLLGYLSSGYQYDLLLYGLADKSMLIYDIADGLTYASRLRFLPASVPYSKVSAEILADVSPYLCKMIETGNSDTVAFVNIESDPCTREELLNVMKAIKEVGGRVLFHNTVLERTPEGKSIGELAGYKREKIAPRVLRYQTDIPSVLFW